MNKVSRLLGSATLATCLAVGGGALAAGPASANDNRSDDRSHSRYDNDKDRRDRDERDRRDRERRDSNRHNDYKYLVRCHNWRGNHWYEWSYNNYDNRRNCYVVLKVRY